MKGATKYPHHNNYVSKISVDSFQKPMKGIPIRGTLCVFDSFLSFCEAVKKPHTRNKVVYRSKYFSARITKTGEYSITFHISVADAQKTAIKKRVVQQFIKMMSTLSSLTD